jgi:hypothetical protein
MLTTTFPREIVRLKTFIAQYPRQEKVLMQTGRQILVTDYTATVLSNFLAVFLALAARSLYNIGRRIAREIKSRQDVKIQPPIVSITGSADNIPLATTSTNIEHGHVTDGTSSNPPPTGQEEIDVTDSEEAAQIASDLELDRLDHDGHQTHPLDNVVESDD